MKKVLYSIIIVLAIFIMMPITKAENKVKVYMFTKNGCPACETAFNYFDKLLEESPDLFELVNIEVWCGVDYTAEKHPWIQNSDEAVNLLLDVIDELKIDTSDGIGTPTIVIGDYAQIGANNMSDMEERIKKAIDSKTYKDVVEELATENNVKVADLVKPRDTASCDIRPATEEKNGSKYDAIIIVGIFVVLIGGFAGLVIISKK